MIIHYFIENNNLCALALYIDTGWLYTRLVCWHNSAYKRVLLVVTVILARIVYVDSVYHDTDNKTTHSHFNV
jgi:hypothetical protein